MRGFWNTRRDRWAKEALERLWATDAPPKRLGLGPFALSQALKEASEVQYHYRWLTQMDASLERTFKGDAPPRVSLTQEDCDLLGLDAEPEAPKSRRPDADFEARVHAYLVADGWSEAPNSRRAVWPIAGVFFALASAAAIVFILLNAGKVEQLTAQADRDDTWMIRGAGATDSLPVDISALCLKSGSGERPDINVARSGQDPLLSCGLDESIQVTVTNPVAEAWSVGMFAIQSDGQPLPYGPTPTNTAPIVLKAKTGQQAVGRPHRLKVNHSAGSGWLVVVGSKTPIDYTMLQAAMKVWPTIAQNDRSASELERYGWEPFANALGHPLTFLRVVPLDIQPEGDP